MLLKEGKNLKILDVGCGNMSLSSLMKKAGENNVIGIDLSKESIKTSKKKGKAAFIAEMKKPAMKSTALKIMEQPVCDSCLGRQFGQVSTGMTNLDRGNILRKLLGSKEPKKCYICGDIFKRLERYSMAKFSTAP